MYNLGFTKYDLAIGLAVIGIAVLLVFPPIESKVGKDHSAQARKQAESIARGLANMPHDGLINQALVGTLAETDSGARNGSSELEDLPRDPWDHPFSVWILPLPLDLNTRTAVVISAGPDGVLQTNPESWSESEMTLASGTGVDNSDHDIAPVPEDLFMGDDVGFILPFSSPGALK